MNISLNIFWAISAGSGTVRFSKSFVGTERIFPALTEISQTAKSKNFSPSGLVEAKNLVVFGHKTY